MSQSNSSTPTLSRFTLKLKDGARKAPRENKTPSRPEQPSKVNQKPAAAWSDEYKQRMQADMDRLSR
jgi:hypothetical protein